jgi:hypothetical protein
MNVGKFVGKEPANQEKPSDPRDGSAHIRDAEEMNRWKPKRRN